MASSSSLCGTGAAQLFALASSSCPPNSQLRLQAVVAALLLLAVHVPAAHGVLQVLRWGWSCKPKHELTLSASYAAAGAPGGHTQQAALDRPAATGSSWCKQSKTRWQQCNSSQQQEHAAVFHETHLQVKVAALLAVLGSHGHAAAKEGQAGRAATKVRHAAGNMLSQVEPSEGAEAPGKHSRLAATPSLSATRRVLN